MDSVIAGGNFWKGAEQGVIATTYNHAVHGLYNKITEEGESPYDGYKKDKNGNYIRVDGRGGDKIDYLYDEEGNIIASTPVSFTEIEVGPYRRTYGQGTKYVSPALYDPTLDVFVSWASGEILGLAAVKVFRYLSGVAKVGTKLWPAASNGRTVINGIEYTTHALERMQPAGTIIKGTKLFSRGVPPSAVENAVKFGKVTSGNTAAEVVRTFENVQVITNPQGTRVISVIKLGH